MSGLTLHAAWAPAMLAALILLGGCDLIFGERDPLERMRDKISGDYRPESRNTQTEAVELMAALCDRRGFSEPECGCVRDAMLDAGTQAMAYVGANYGGDLVAAAEIAQKLEPAERSAAIAAYLAAEQTCRAPVAPAPRASDPDSPNAIAPATPDVTLADIRASCRPAMAEICVCRAQTLDSAVGDGGMAAALAINRNDAAGLARLAEGRGDGWAEAVADAYARTSAPCIVQASRRN